jgi:hypothetical protein
MARARNISKKPAEKEKRTHNRAVSSSTTVFPERSQRPIIAARCFAVLSLGHSIREVTKMEKTIKRAPRTARRDLFAD